MALTAEQQAEIDKALEKEVNEIDNFREPEPEVPPVEPPPADTPPPEDAGEPPPAEPAEPPPGPVPEPERSPEPPPAEDITEELRKQINEQNKLIMSLQKQMRAAPEPEVAQPTPQPPPPTIPKVPLPTQPPPPEMADIDYVADLDMDDISADPEIFNQVLNRVVKRAVEVARAEASQEAVQKTLLAIPQVIQAQIHQQTFITEAVNSFYEENADLQPVKETVAQVAQNIAAEHPEYDIKQLFTEAAKVTRTVLKMPEFKGTKATANRGGEFRNPAFAARKNSVRETSGEISKLQAELDEL